MSPERLAEVAACSEVAAALLFLAALAHAVLECRAAGAAGFAVMGAACLLLERAAKRALLRG